MTAIKIITAHLKSIGADGLVFGAAECACKLDDLAPCSDDIRDCAPGWLGADIDGDWAIYPSPEAAAKSRWGAA